jgi:hypothetical protein
MVFDFLQKKKESLIEKLSFYNCILKGLIIKAFQAEALLLHPIPDLLSA